MNISEKMSFCEAYTVILSSQFTKLILYLTKLVFDCISHARICFPGVKL